MIKHILKQFLRNPLRKLLGMEPAEVDIDDLRKKGVKIGKDCNILHGVILDSSHYWHISIGDHVTIAPYVYFICHDASIKRQLNFARIGKIIIGNHVFIGARSIIMPNTKIGDNSIIGAGSVVTKNIPSGVVAAGNPARVICDVNEFYDKHRYKINELPCFGEEYTIRKNVNNLMKEDMNNKMVKGEGYII